MSNHVESPLFDESPTGSMGEISSQFWIFGLIKSPFSDGFLLEPKKKTRLRPGHEAYSGPAFGLMTNGSKIKYQWTPFGHALQ